MDAPDSEAPTFLQMISSEAIRPLQADGCLLKRFYFIHQVGRKWQLAEDNYKFPPFYSYVSPHDTVATLFVRLRLHAEGLGSNVVKLAILRQKPLFLDESSAVKVLESVSESEDVRFGLLTGLEFIHEEPSGKPRYESTTVPSPYKLIVSLI